MGHHFSSIAGAGPINGPIQAAVFGWVPVMLWVLIGGIFFGGVHDFGALFASIRHKGESIGEVIGDAIGAKAKKLFITFAYLTLILVVAAFASIVANTFKATYTADGAIDYADIFSANGIKAYLFESLRPTPEISFAIRQLGCQAGVNVTARHNPREYNGYKAYWEDGAQVLAPHDKGIIDEVNKVTINDVKAEGNRKLIKIIGGEMDSQENSCWKINKK